MIGIQGDGEEMDNERERERERESEWGGGGRREGRDDREINGGLEQGR